METRGFRTRPEPFLFHDPAKRLRALKSLIV